VRAGIREIALARWSLYAAAMLRASLFVLFSVVLAGCGASVAEEPAVDPLNAPPIPREQWCEAQARAVCRQFVPCCNAVDLGGDSASCIKNVAAECETTSAKNAAAGYTYDARAAGVCIAGNPLLRVDCTISTHRYVFQSVDPTALAVEAACLRVWRGNAKPGAACEQFADCAEPSDGTKVACTKSAPDAALTCVASKVPTVGQACGIEGDTHTFCERGLVCVTHDVSAPGLKGRCAVRSARGEPCQPLTKGHCRDGLSCDPATRTCADPLPLGAACFPSTGGLLGELETICAAPGECDIRTQICTKPLPIDAPCDAGAPARSAVGCGHFAFCDPSRGRCVARKPAGSPCTSQQECIGYACSGNRCVTNGEIADAATCTLAGGGPR
jgi:hypothetical protein